MSQTFQDKNILIISPQGWGKMHLSKHHYAIELAKMGNTVYFLDPIKPVSSLKFDCKINEVAERLHHVYTEAWLPYDLRFKLPGLFNFLIKYYVKKIIRKLGVPLDIVWCFNVHHFSDLRVFGAPFNIFHPVDIFEGSDTNISRYADVVFATTDDILLKFANSDVPSYKIEHGVSSYFLQHSENYRRTEVKNYSQKRQINIGYVGNLMMHGVDREGFTRIVEENSNVAFHIWGPYEKGKTNISRRKNYLDEDTSAFVEQIKGRPNVTLYGIKTPEEIAVAFQEMDGFLICYDLDKESNRGANSHKVLEYLSTGKVSICNRILAYSDRPGLIEMLSGNDNLELPDLFKNVINNLGDYNSQELKERRIDFALSHSYPRQIEKIADIISNHGLL